MLPRSEMAMMMHRDVLTVCETVLTVWDSASPSSRSNIPITLSKRSSGTL